MNAEGTGQPDAAQRIARARGLSVIQNVAIGTRVVVRSIHAEGAIDSLGDVVSRTALAVVIATRRGERTVALSDVVAARVVPPPPVKR